MIANIKPHCRSLFWHFQRYTLKTGLAALIVVGVSGCLSTHKLENNFVPSKTPQTFDRLQKNNKWTKFGGQQHLEIVKNHGGEYQDPMISRMVARIVGALTAVSENPVQSYKLTILDSPAINAFALPGGYLYITRGLLALANDEAEIAAVISHEMAHVIANHGMKRQRQKDAALISNQVISEILTGKLVGSDVLARNKLRLAAFSRQQELQADEIGIRMLAQANYDPYAAIRFLKSLENHSNFLSNKTSNSSFLSSHPSTPKRRAAASRHVKRFASTRTNSRNRSAFLKDIDGIIYGERADHGYIRAQTFLHPDLAIRFDVPEGFKLNNTSEAVFANGPNEISMQFDAVEVDTKSSLIEYITEGWIKGLDRSTIRQTSINGLPAITARAQGGRWIYDITIIQYQEFYYRFLTAVPRAKARHLLVVKDIVASFRALTKSEQASLKPLRIRVLNVKANDTITSLAAKMEGTNRKVELFHILNALPAKATLIDHRSVKIISQ